jgi:glycosyltransferase involved in cell wall biosynthesis
LKIVLLTGEYPPQPGGVGDYTRCLGDALRARGHELAVLTIQGGALVCYGAGGQVLPLRPSAPGRDWSFRAWPVLIEALEALRPSWVHIQYQTGAYAMRPGVNLLPWRLRRRAERPRLAVTFHDLLVPYLFPKAGPLRPWVNGRLANDADAVVATNPADLASLRALLRRDAPPPQLIPIGSNIPVAPPPGFDRAAWRAGLGVAPGELLVAYFGLLSPSKGADVLAEALAGLARPWRLLLIGGAATAPQDLAHAEAVRARIAALGITERVISTGHVEEREVSAHLLAADCAALPYSDGASYRRGSLLAALAHGCPVVTTTPADRATADELAGCALLVPPGQPRALAAAVARIAAEPTLGPALADAGRSVAARFSWDAIAAQHEALYAGAAQVTPRSR